MFSILPGAMSQLAPLLKPVSVQHWHVLTAVIAIGLAWAFFTAFYNIYLHPLAHFPGPRLAAASKFWLAYQEFVRGISLSDLRDELHAQYGDIVRLQPNLLHFANPHAYNEIYNVKNKWDKDTAVYRAFGMDESSACFVKYKDAKFRRDVLSPMFSRSSILKMQDLIQERVNIFSGALAAKYAAGKSSNIYLGFRCFATDVLMHFCYDKSLEATRAPDFEAEIVLALDGMIPVLSLCKYSSVLAFLVHRFPAWLAKNAGSPVLAALFRLRKLLTAQIDAILRNPSELELAAHPTIYHALLSPEANKGRPLPSRKSLMDEAGILLGAGADTTGVALTTITHHVLHNPATLERLKAELRAAWPVLEDVPRYEMLEKLPYLTAVIKEGLRMFPSAIAHPRVVPQGGAVISGSFIPSGVSRECFSFRHDVTTPRAAAAAAASPSSPFFWLVYIYSIVQTVVGQSFVFVHRSPIMYERPEEFLPERWLGPEAKACEAALSVFSKGPRSCLGVNLAYIEMYTALAHLFRMFDPKLDESRPTSLKIKEHFVPVFVGEPLHVYCRPVVE
ncbi:putative P450 monooxygenase [Lactarius akahatsu]|uniref:P450 monooxygenase n=1 Tax=Lactarius akahatsu TaxID=416441 RepID=A0AAD4LN88_9AGAM|nr:putative P450 monooxygenase [Lactarius akahatsu]